MRPDMQVLNLERPLSPAEDGNRFTVPRYSVDIQTFIADHEIVVLHRVVDAHGPALFQRLVLKAADRVREAHAQRQMAGGILIEQGFIEQNA